MIMSPLSFDGHGSMNLGLGKAIRTNKQMSFGAMEINNSILAAMLDMLT